MTLTVEGIEPARGGEVHVYVFLGQGFPIKHEKAVKRYRFEVTTATYSLPIEVPDVPFAIKVHHDEDRSGGVTKNWTGVLPAEGLGFSSGARMGLGPPSFKEAAMNRPESGVGSVSVRYP